MLCASLVPTFLNILLKNSVEVLGLEATANAGGCCAVVWYTTGLCCWWRRSRRREWPQYVL